MLARVCVMVGVVWMEGGREGEGVCFCQGRAFVHEGDFKKT